MESAELFQALTHNRRLKMRWVWEWLGRLPMHFEVEEIGSSSTSNDGSNSHDGDRDSDGAGEKIDEECEMGYRQDVAKAEGESERVLSRLAGMVRRGRKRHFVEGEGKFEVVDLTRDDEAQVLEGNGGRPLKKARRGGL